MPVAYRVINEVRYHLIGERSKRRQAESLATTYAQEKGAKSIVASGIVKKYAAWGMEMRSQL